MKNFIFGNVISVVVICLILGFLAVMPEVGAVAVLNCLLYGAIIGLCASGVLCILSYAFGDKEAHKTNMIYGTIASIVGTVVALLV